MIGKMEVKLNCNEKILVPAGNVFICWFVLNKETLGTISCGVNNSSGGQIDCVGRSNLLVGNKVQFKLSYLLRLKFYWTCI